MSLLTVEERKQMEQYLLQLHSLRDMPAWQTFVAKVQVESKTAYSRMVEAKDSYEAARQTGQYIAFNGMVNWLDQEIAAVERTIELTAAEP